MKNYFYIAPTGDGWRNLAIDEHLLNTLEPGEMCLLLYINSNAVILGRNQNPWAECNLEKMREDEVQLVRRCTGGGAVFHDNGNLNYSFIASDNRYDEARQTGLILSALQNLGINAECSGRNDLTVDGKKFSGTAFCSRGGNRQHHGTLLVSADLTRLANYLTVSPLKLQAKGVKSVRSRVCNLNEIAPDISVGEISERLKCAFAEEYGEISVLEPDVHFLAGVDALYERNRSWAWQLGKAPDFDYVYENRLNFGMVRLCINVREGLISEATLYTDALDIEISGRIEQKLLNSPFNLEQIPNMLLAEHKD